MENLLSDELKEMLNTLVELHELAYNQIKPTVEYIIKNNIKDLNFIEHTLDSLLDIPTDKCYKLFIKLCDYTSQIDKELALEYLEIYEDLYGEEKPKAKKKL